MWPVVSVLSGGVEAHLLKAQLTPGNQEEEKKNKVSAAWTLTGNEG